MQPVAHALLQAREELAAIMSDFPEELLWRKPGGAASPAFHLQHLSGVLDRVFTYARGEALSPVQLEELYAEEKPFNITILQLVTRFNLQVDKALVQLQYTDETSLTDLRGVGRRKLPSTVIGLLVHAAEHTMRHLGQLLVTVKVLRSL